MAEHPGIMKTVTINTVTRYEVAAGVIEDLLKRYVIEHLHREAGQIIEVEWDASSEGLVRGATVTLRDVKEETT